MISEGENSILGEGELRLEGVGGGEGGGYSRVLLKHCCFFTALHTCKFFLIDRFSPTDGSKQNGRNP